MLKKGDKVGIVCCSNGQASDQKNIIEKMIVLLSDMGLETVISPVLYTSDAVFPGTVRERAEALMAFYRDTDISAIFDISGGDIANMLLPYLDYEIIAENPKPLWGYSDLTTILNGIYAKTGNMSVLFQMKNIVWDKTDNQHKRLTEFCNRETDSLHELSLFDVQYRFLQGVEMEGVVVGGNIRCFLKLAGTAYWPNLQGKILLLEGLGGGVAQYAAYLGQLEQLGVFEQVSGILLGTFSQMEQEKAKPTVEDMLFELLHQSENPYVQKLSVVKTEDIGHGTLTKAIVIGKRLSLHNTKEHIYNRNK